MYNPPTMSSSLGEYYARRAGEYEAVYAKPERQADLERLRGAVAQELAGHDVLELACGTGYWTAVIAAVASSVLATDAVAEVLELARRKPLPAGKVEFATADAWDPPAGTSARSAVFAGFWWSHVARQRLAEFLTGLAGRLGPGKQAVFIDNRFVPGSSTPISRRDPDGNTYQRRRLADGGEVEVLKNFPTRAELLAVATPALAAPRVLELEHYWLLAGVTRRPVSS
jgi:demethylmenaquinone methyltransferase/2-methoxy-6-polyprenyl-1,4-benzoquinol methylase